jgi:hypothetical protein
MANLVNFEAKYSDACYLNQADTMSLIMSVAPGITPSTPEFGAYIDLYQYRNNGGVYPDDCPGLNPNMRAVNINGILPSLDKFYFFLEAQIHSDGKLYFGTNLGNQAALVLNAAGTNWADNTGSISGGWVSDTNPDYAYSAYAIKNSIYYLWAPRNLRDLPASDHHKKMPFGIVAADHKCSSNTILSAN